MLSGAVYCQSRDSELQYMGSSENITSHSSTIEDEASIVEECDEDDDSDDHYASIQRPAFIVDGEPNSYSDPPEDGWEYLRQVRYSDNSQQFIYFFPV